MMMYLIYIIIVMASLFEKDDIENIKEEPDGITSQCIHSLWKNTFRVKGTRDFLEHMRSMLQNTKRCWRRKLPFSSDIPCDSFYLFMPSVKLWKKNHENRRNFGLQTILKSLTDLRNSKFYWPIILYPYTRFSDCIFILSASLLNVPFQNSYHWEMTSSFREEEMSTSSCSLETPMLWFKTKMTFIKIRLSLLTNLWKRGVFHDTNLYMIPSLWELHFGFENEVKKGIFFICDNYPQYIMLLYLECNVIACCLNCFSNVNYYGLFTKSDVIYFMFNELEFKECSYPGKLIHYTSFYVEYVIHTMSWDSSKRQSDDLYIARTGISINQKYLNEVPMSNYLCTVRDSDYLFKRLTFEWHGNLCNPQRRVEYIWPLSSTLENNYLIRRNHQQMQYEMRSTVALYQNVNADNFLTERLSSKFQQVEETVSYVRSKDQQLKFRGYQDAMIFGHMPVIRMSCENKWHFTSYEFKCTYDVYIVSLEQTMIRNIQSSSQKGISTYISSVISIKNIQHFNIHKCHPTYPGSKLPANMSRFIKFSRHLKFFSYVDTILTTKTKPSKQRKGSIENATQSNENTMKGNEEVHSTSYWFDICNLTGSVLKSITAFFIGLVNTVLLVMYQHFRKHTLDNFDHEPSTASWNVDGNSKNEKNENNFQENKPCYTLHIHLQLDIHHAVFVLEVLLVHIVLLGCFIKPFYQKIILISKDRSNWKSTLCIPSIKKIFIGYQKKFEVQSVVRNRECFVPEKCSKSEDTIVCESTNSFNMLATNKSTWYPTKAKMTNTCIHIEGGSMEHHERSGCFPNVTDSFDKPNAIAFLEDEDNQQTLVKSLDDDIPDLQLGVMDMDEDESNFNILSRAVNGNFNERDDIYLNSEQNKRKLYSISSVSSEKCEDTVITADTSNQTDSFPKDCVNSFSLKSNLSSLSTTYDKESSVSDNVTSLRTCSTCCASVNGNTIHDEKESIINLVKETNSYDESVRIVTSLSKYTDSTFRPKKDKHHNKLIEHSVRKFFLSREKRRRRQNNRRILRELPQCVNIISFLEPGITICSPLHTDKSSLVHNEGNQSEFVSERNQPLQNNHDTSTDDNEQGHLSSIFNSFSIDSLHGEHRYNMEWMRLASFANFDSQSVHAIRLARNGWYSTGNRDQTMCFSCHRLHEDWTRDDNPDEFHDTECRFIQNALNNIPIPRSLSEARENELTLDRNRTSDIATDLAATYISPSYEGESTAERSRSLSAYQTSENLESTAASSTESARQSQLEELKKDPMGINFDRPKYPSYAIPSVRVSSFSGWHSHKTQTPRDLALAGFFYAGYGDYTRCFFCGGGLRNWEDGDDPWVEHARWFSQCAFVRQNKGQEFIDLVQQRAHELEREQGGEFQNDLSENEKSKDEKVMNSEAVLAIKRMGYTEDTIRTAINTLKSRLPKGKHKVSAQDILEVIFEIESKTNTQATQQEITSAEQAVGGKTTTTDLTPETLENKSLSDQITCQICQEKKVSIAFLPCSHLVCCEDCAPAMRTCPFCGKFIKGTVKTFLV